MSAIGYDQSCSHIKRGGLTGAVRTQQTDNLALLHIEAHIVNNGTLTIPLHETFRA